MEQTEPSCMKKLKMAMGDKGYEPMSQKELYMLEPFLSDRNCNHHLFDMLISSHHSSNTLVADFYAINNGNFEWPPPPLDPSRDDRYEAPAIESWRESVKSLLFCQNCWLTLISSGYLEKLLLHISKRLHDEDISKRFIFQKQTLIQQQFLLDLIRYPSTLQYVFKHKHLYRLLFSIFLKLFQIVYSTDIYLIGKRNGDIDEVFIFEKVTETFLEQFHETAVYWTPDNLQFLLKIGFKELITRSVPNNIVRNQKLGKQNDFNVYKEVENCLELIIGFDYAARKKRKLLHDKEEKDIFIGNIMYLMMPGWGLNEYTKESMVESFCSMSEPENESIGWSICKWHRIYIDLIFNEEKVNKERKEWKRIMCNQITQKKLMTICFNPECDVRKYKRKCVGWIGWFTARTNPDVRDLIKRDFYRCKGCLMAVYCSKRCQKIHWNTFNHRAQCKKV
eukprot:893587_1